MNTRMHARTNARIDAPPHDPRRFRNFWRQTIRQRAFWRHAFRVFAFLLCAHAIVAASLVPIFGMLTAVVYVAVPPMASIAAYDAIQSAPLFAALCTALALVAAGTLWPVARAVAAEVPLLARTLALLGLAIWVPTLSAESLRWALMQHEILQAQPQCHGERTLMASLRARNAFLADFDHGPSPHAWMLKDGEMRLWSYRRMRFEAAPDGGGGALDCRTAANLTDPSVGQRW